MFKARQDPIKHFVLLVLHRQLHKIMEKDDPSIMRLLLKLLPSPMVSAQLQMFFFFFFFKPAHQKVQFVECNTKQNGHENVKSLQQIDIALT